jgi:prevent-host-death family protein
MGPKEISTSHLKAHCSETIERVAGGRETVVVTRRGRPVARIVPIEAELPTLFGFARGAIRVAGDLIEPLDVAWEVSDT